MKLRYLRGTTEFHCLAGDCPDTCCRDWAVALDPAAERRYRELPGPLGEALRGAIALVDGEVCLQLRGGRCPLLDAQGLCRVQLELGESGLCESCRLHPRFAEEYGALQEWRLSLACPEAARLLLSESAPLSYTETVTERPVSGYNAIDPRLFYILQSARDTAFSIVQDRRAPWRLRIWRLLSFGGAMQRAMDQHHIARLKQIVARFAAGRFPHRIPAWPTDPLGLLDGLETIDGRWPALLAQARATTATAAQHALLEKLVPAHEPEHLLYYYLYRDFLKSVVDRRLLAWVRLAAFHVLCLRELELSHLCSTGELGEADRVELLHRYSREVDHSEENVMRLLERLEAL